MNRRHFLKTGTIALFASSFAEKLFASKASHQTTAPFGPVTCENTLPGKTDSKPIYLNASEASNQEDLKVLFLGTGAAGWKSDGSSPRRNSSILLEDKLLIDFTISVEDMLPSDIHPKEIFYTHSHGDHYQPERALLLGIKTVYLSETWIDRATKDFKSAAANTGLSVPTIIPLKLYEPINIHGLTITPLPANHCTSDYNEQALIYLIEKGTTEEKLGVRLLYATDTGGIMGRASKPAGIDSHKSNTTPRAITAFVMEATMGMGHDEDFRIFNHSSANTVSRIANMLIATKRYLPPAGQPVYLTHISPGLHDNKSQEALNNSLPNPLRAAYDGLEVVFKAVE